ncbi:MAG: DUF1461 domain-containing protein [Chloroflexota bacterium]|nr:DUF1461 domain-containing protein [Chloroflexota bacterium]MDE2909401.1 DUF1461 domain-containing protein [Chloroflexota bacterium]
MTNRRALHLAVRLYFSLVMPFLLVIAGTRLLLNERFLRFEYQRPGFPADPYGFTAEDRLDFGPYALNYLFNAETITYLAALRLPGDKCWNAAAGAADCALFSRRELQHMLDVKQATAVAFALGASFALAACGIAAASRFNDGLRSDIVVGIGRGCKLTLLSVAALSVFSLGAWDQAFDSFHQLLFAEGTWRFPFSDSLIRLYPEQLFLDASLAIAVFASLCAATLLWLLSRWPGRNRRQC